MDAMSDLVKRSIYDLKSLVKYHIDKGQLFCFANTRTPYRLRFLTAFNINGLLYKATRLYPKYRETGGLSTKLCLATKQMRLSM